MSTPHPEQALFKAGLYEPAVKACQSVADVPDLMGKVQLLQAAIKYEQDDLMNTKAFIEGCPPEEAETSINHACVMYKEALQPGAEPAMFEKARLRFQEAMNQTGFQVSLRGGPQAGGGTGRAAVERALVGEVQHQRAISRGPQQGRRQGGAPRRPSLRTPRPRQHALRPRP